MFACKYSRNSGSAYKLDLYAEMAQSLAPSVLICTLVALHLAPAFECGTTAIVNSGVYKIQSDNDQMVLTAADNGVLRKSLGATKSDVSQNIDEQKWTVKSSPKLAAGGKQLRSFMSRKNANNNLSFNLALPGTTPTVRYWEFVHLGAGKWQIKSYPEGKCLQNMGRTYAVQEKTCDGANRNQKWNLLICNSLRCSERRRR